MRARMIYLHVNIQKITHKSKKTLLKLNFLFLPSNPAPPKSPAGGLHENQDLTSPPAGDLGGAYQEASSGWNNVHK
jgi:hypothetical protein